MTSKQVKVDNWGIFFLQQLKHFFNKTYFCDLTLQFDDNVQLKVHRLVLNACTEYFNMLEQTCEMINDCLIMPPDLQADVVVPIVNFMYTGILEFQESIFDRLYAAAKLMNMSVLTKLLDAQKVPILPIIKPINKKLAPVTWNLQGKKITPKTMDPDLPEQLPGRKLPIWKRKSTQSAVTYRATEILKSTSESTSKYDDTPKPSRFEWPEDEESNFNTIPFDEISYTSKPLQFSTREKSPKPSTSNFEELKRTSTGVKRAASPLPYDSKKMNIQDVKEYLKEQKLRSDYNDYDDAEAQDNDLQTYNDDDSAEENDIEGNQFGDDASNKSILKHDSTMPHNKRVRFNIDSKENTEAGKSTIAKCTASTYVKSQVPADMSNHTKIITEVLKKYPHLVKKNKNIRLKILAKGSNAANNPNMKPLGTPVKVAKPTAKVSYMVMKPDQKQSANPPTAETPEKSWTCTKCTIPKQFDSYHTYRNHLTDIHKEKMDSQMCNICGHTSRKQNMLMYHKFVKHNVPPPPIYQFPKCEECPYIALSPNLLLKHQYHHMHLNLLCRVCMTRFQTKSALVSHMQLTGHNDMPKSEVYECSYCSKKFTTDETLFQHIKKNHTEAARRDNLISQEEDVEELQDPDKPKEKIKILSNIKVNKTLKTNQLIPVKNETVTKVEHVEKIEDSQPSSEAESLSNVASGIAASLGLVNTIVVLDDNQFILQSQDEQENMASTSQAEFIIPDVTTLDNLPNVHVSQHQMITADNNTIISQAGISRDNIGSTDELVMVLTDHDYSDATNNTVMTTENSNIVVLYSHPVQNQDGQYITQQGDLMLNSGMGIMEVGDTYTTVPMAEKCEESIEMIQREINNHLEEETLAVNAVQNKTLEEKQITLEDVKPNILEEPLIANEDTIETPNGNLISQDQHMEMAQVEENNVNEIAFENQVEDSKENVSLFEPENIPIRNVDQYEEPMDVDESIELIQEELNKNGHTFESEKETANSNEETVHEENIANETFDEQEIVEEIPQTVDEIGSNVDTIIEKEIISEDERMEVDSSKVNDGYIEETTGLTENIIEEINTDNYISDEVVPDSEEEKATDECDTQELVRTQESTDLMQDTENSEQLNIEQTIGNGDNTGENVDQMEENIEQIEENVEKIEETVQQLEENIRQIEENIDHTEESIVHMEESMPQIEENVEDFVKKIDQIEENASYIEESFHQIADVGQNEETDDHIVESADHIEGNAVDIEENLEQFGESVKQIQEPVDQILEPVDHIEQNIEHFEENIDQKEEKLTQINELVDENQKIVNENSDQMAENTDTINEQIEENIDASNTTLEENTNLILENKNFIVESSVSIENKSMPIIEKLEILKENSKNIEPSEIQEMHIPNVEIAKENSIDNETTTESLEMDIQPNIEIKLSEITETTQEVNKITEELQITLNKEIDVTANEVITDEKESCSGNLTDNNINGVVIQKLNKVDIEPLSNPRISNLLDDWDDGDTDSLQSDTAKPAITDTKSSINTLINDWEDDEST